MIARSCGGFYDHDAVNRTTDRSHRGHPDSRDAAPAELHRGAVPDPDWSAGPVHSPRLAHYLAHSRGSSEDATRRTGVAILRAFFAAPLPCGSKISSSIAFLPTGL